ncbi:MAG: transposase [Verrucomicrobia bacterium]|nr:transposase [Verrucomicrobiota bacterium]
MNAIQEIFRVYGGAYLAHYGERVPTAHRKVIHAIGQCRSGGFGHHLYRCAGCAKMHVANSSCGNRHCPVCQSDKSERWLMKEQNKALPCSYFLLTFTVPEALRPFLRSHQRDGYTALFEAASDALRVLSADPRFVGAAHSGFTGILHTWGRQLQYHPHLHFIVPGGGLNETGSAWRRSRPEFFVHVHPLSRAFRYRFRQRMRKKKLEGMIPPEVWNQEWNVHSQAVGDGQATLRYLANYVFRVGITANRIHSWSNGKVRFGYRKVGSRRERVMELDAVEFIRRFLLHVLPKGFMKIRHYGFLHPNAGVSPERVRTLIIRSLKTVAEQVAARLKLGRTSPPRSAPKSLSCSRCGGPMRWFRFIPAVAPG